MTSRPAPSTAFYIGGFEAIGGIEACFEDLAVGLSGQSLERSLFVWADDLPQLRAIAASGTRVYRSPLRKGSRFALPDWALLLIHGRKLRAVDRIVFGKIPPDPVFRRLLSILDKQPGGRPELLYVTAYRPSEMWPGKMPALAHAAIDTIIVQSSEFAADLRDRGFAGRIETLPYLPPRATNPSKVPDAKGPVCRLGFLGRFVAQKNLFYLLDILAHLADEAVELHLYGDGEHGARLRADVAMRGLPVTFHGAVPRTEVANAIDACDIFLNPSISEGQCLVALEVLSRGRPFIASAVGAIPHILAQGRLGAILPLANSSAAASVVRRILDEWRAGLWDPVDVASAYAAAYRPDEILTRYLNLFTGRVTTDEVV